MKSTANKKILISAGIIVIILIALLILFLSSRHSQSPQQPQTNTNTYSTYHNDSYTLSYPDTWTKTEKTLSNNEGNVVTFLPQMPNSGHYATISIEVLNGQLTSIDSMAHLFKALNYTQTTNTVAGLTAEKYIAVLPSPDGDLHSIVYLFQQDEKIYSLKLEYVQNDANLQLEGQFYQIINSFST